MVKEKLVNIPNTLTLIRVILSFFILWMYFVEYSLISILWVFLVAAFTDFLDGFTARRYNQETLFGARFDIFADRILWVIFGIILIFGYDFFYTAEHLVQFSLIFSREIVCGIFLIFYMIFFKEKNFFPYVRWSGKITTTLQGIIIPLLVLSQFYPILSFYRFLIPIVFISGIISSFYYISDLGLSKKSREEIMHGFYEKINPVALASYQKKM